MAFSSFYKGGIASVISHFTKGYVKGHCKKIRHLRLHLPYPRILHTARPQRRPQSTKSKRETKGPGYQHQSPGPEATTFLSSASPASRHSVSFNTREPMLLSTANLLDRCWGWLQMAHASLATPTQQHRDLRCMGWASATSSQQVNLASAGGKIEGTSDVTLVRGEMQAGPKS